MQYNVNYKSEFLADFIILIYYTSIYTPSKHQCTLLYSSLLYSYVFAAPQMESRYAVEMEEHKQKLDKEYETTRQTFVLELDKLKRKMIQDLEKRVGTAFMLKENIPMLLLFT